MRNPRTVRSRSQMDGWMDAHILLPGIATLKFTCPSSSRQLSSHFHPSIHPSIPPPSDRRAAVHWCSSAGLTKLRRRCPNRSGHPLQHRHQKAIRPSTIESTESVSSRVTRHSQCTCYAYLIILALQRVSSIGGDGKVGEVNSGSLEKRAHAGRRSPWPLCSEAKVHPPPCVNGRRHHSFARCRSVVDA
jgi:hypothetical protein